MFYHLRRALHKVASSCPLRSYFYGGLPEGGGYGSSTEFEIGAQRIAEAVHCILGSLGRAVMNLDRIEEYLPYEYTHINEEIGIIEKCMKEYARPLYTDRMNNPRDDKDIMYIEKSVENIRENSPELASTAEQMLAELTTQDDLPDYIIDIGVKSYSVVIALANAMLDSVSGEVVENPYIDTPLRVAVLDLRNVINSNVNAIN